MLHNTVWVTGSPYHPRPTACTLRTMHDERNVTFAPSQVAEAEALSTAAVTGLQKT
jgi:hypothetical protein